MQLTQEILTLLQQDATLTPKTIAAMTGSDEKTVSDEIGRLREEGVILGYTIRINTEKSPVPMVEAIIEVKVSPQRDLGYNDIARRIYKFPEVESVFLMSGAYDLAVKIQAPTMQAISAFVWEKLAVLDGVTGTATLFIMRKYKENGTILVEDEMPERLVITP